jgi:hypothetical protein
LKFSGRPIKYVLYILVTFKIVLEISNPASKFIRIKFDGELGKRRLQHAVQGASGIWPI